MNRFTVMKVRPISADAMVAFIKAQVDVPSGPMAGVVETLACAVIVQEADGWKIASFQNTRKN